MSFLEAEFTKLAEALLAKSSQEDGRADSQQRLIGANIGGSAFTTDMLLASLQCQYVTGLLFPTLFNRLPDKSTWHETHILIACRHEAKRRTAIAHGIAKAHEFAYSDIGAIIAGSCQHAKRSRLGNIGNEDGFAFVRDWFNRTHIFNAAEEVGLLHDYC